MPRILYGALEPDQNLVSKLAQDNTISYQGNWFDFRLELIRCKGEYLRKYDCVYYDTRLCPENLPSRERFNFFVLEMLGYLEALSIPVNVIVDEELRDKLPVPAKGNIGFLKKKKRRKA